MAKKLVSITVKDLAAKRSDISFLTGIIGIEYWADLRKSPNADEQFEKTLRAKAPTRANAYIAGERRVIGDYTSGMLEDQERYRTEVMFLRFKKR